HPLNEYKSEAFELFNELITHLREQVTGQMMRIEVIMQAPPQPQPTSPPMETIHADPVTGENEEARPQLAYAGPVERDPTKPSTWGRVGRNELCPCGSGKKFKHCHGGEA
ncbi:MAG: preprotein translocase subunit SecA, partial [Alphaproteobacteria bacterium]|nr:preprotein translocase subunit SecA [Alphaproteobacteria bacterium]